MFHSGLKGYHGRGAAAPKKARAPRPRRSLCEKKNSELVKILDTEFSFNVRARAVVAGGGLARCVTCGKPGGMADLDCGHYITRAIFRTRWLMKNTGPQCPKCNRYLNGMAHAFRAYLVAVHGEEEVRKLEELARDTGWRDSPEGMIGKITALRAENRELRKELGA